RQQSKPGSAVGESVDAAGPRSAPLIFLILTSTLVAFATNLSMHQLNMRMQDLGISEFGIGISVATQALGIILVAPLAKDAIARFGVRRAFVLGAIITSSTFLSINFLSDAVALSAVRLLFAGGLALLFTISESLVITRTEQSNRGKVVGWYATALAVGTAAGPAFVTVTGVDGFAPLLWSAMLFWLTAVPIVLCVGKGEDLAPVVRTSTMGSMRIMPIAFVTAFIFGVVDNGGISMLSVYSTMNGYDYSQAAMLAATAMVGGVALQVPLGYGANGYDIRMILLLCGVGAIVLLALLPNIMALHTAALGVSFLLGGFLEGFYTVGLICIARNCRSIGISSANGAFVSMCGLGEFVGPLTTGTSIHYLGSQGFVIGLTVLLAAYIVLVAMMKRGASVQSVSV